MTYPALFEQSDIGDALTLQIWRRFPGIWSFVVLRDLQPDDDADSEVISDGWAMTRRDARRIGTEGALSAPDDPPATWIDLLGGLSVTTQIGGPVWWAPRIAYIDGALSIGWLLACVGIKKTPEQDSTNVEAADDGRGPVATGHIAIVDDVPSLSGTYSWFCPEVFKNKCDQQHHGFETYEDALSAALKSDHKVATDGDELPGRYCGIPGLVWYSRVTKTPGGQLKVGHALDSLDHRGARTIQGIRVGTPGSGLREVHFGGGWTVYSDGSSDTETVRDDVIYDVVDMDSICDPMGNPG